MNKGKDRPASDYDIEMKDKFLQMPIEEKRTYYKCSKNYVTVDAIDKVNDQIKVIAKKMAKNDDTKVPDVTKLNVEEAECFGDKISIWQGDITKLEVDSIVNAANETLLGGGGVDGAIHAGAGKLLLAECKTLNGCKTGEAKITGGYLLPAKYVIHTVGPIGEIPDKLKSAYHSCLEVMKSNNLSTIAFPCISTGVYGYPKEAAAKIAMKTVLNFLKTDYGKNVNRVIFSLHLDKDVAIYERLVRSYFESLI